MGFTWHAKPMPIDEAVETMKFALEAGANFWNGGEFYGGREYNSLHLLKAYFTKYPEDADRVVLSIKGGLKTDVLLPDGSEANVRRSVDYCADMLAGLKTIDIFECARVDPNTPIETTIGVLAELVKEGKIRGIGLSEVRAETIRRAVKVHEVAAVEIEFSLWALDPLENGIMSTCAELGIPVVAYSPLGRGIFAGQIKSVKDLPEGDHRHHFPRFQPDVLESNLALVEAIESLASKKGCTPGQIAMAWIKVIGTRHGAPKIIPIPGTRSTERIKENMKQVELTRSELEEIDSILARYEVKGGRYGGPGAKLMDG